MDRKVCFVDVDGVCADLGPSWLNRYNRDYDDNLKTSDMTDWNLDKIVKPECGIKIYDYLKDPHLYDFVFPIEGAKDGVNALRELGYKIVYATSSPIESFGRKFEWLADWGFNPKIREYIEIGDKSVLLGDYMLDDYYKNVSTFKGKACLMTRLWNEKYDWKWRVDNWKNFISDMEKEINHVN